MPNDRFNTLRGDRRLLFYDTTNVRQLDIFVGTFAMCHTMDLSGRFALLPDTLARARIGRHAPWYELPEEVADGPRRLRGDAPRNCVRVSYPHAIVMNRPIEGT